MSANNVNAMVKEAIRILKAGDKAGARALLEQATQLDSYNEQAWLWLSGVVETDEDRLTCLNNVLFINPNNGHAKQGVSMLESKLNASKPEFSVVAPEESPFAQLDLPKGENLLDELEMLRAEANSGADTGSISPFTDTGFIDDMDDAGFAAPDFDDPFADNNQTGPFSANPFTVDGASDPQALITEARRSVLEEQLDTVLSGAGDRPGTQPQRATGTTRRAAPEEPMTAAQMLKIIPKEIRAGRMPGTDAPAPVIYKLVAVLLLVANIGAAVLTVNKALAG
jgi:hypothetical protein